MINSLSFTLALRYLSGRKLRTALTLLAIVFGVTILFGFNGILPAFQEAFQNNLSAAAGQVDLTVTSETRGAFDMEVADTIRDTPGVARVAPSLTRPLVVPASQALTIQDGTTIAAFIMRGIVPEQAAEVTPVSLAEGRFLQANDEHTVLISNTLAEDSGLSVGDTITLPAASGLMTLEVVGITTGRPPLGSEELIIPLVTAQTLFNLPKQINTIEAQFTADSDEGTVQQAVLERLGDGFKLGGNEAGSEFAAAMEAGSFIYTMFGVVALALGGFIILITFRTVVVERRRDIGMLRAIGASRKAILGMILTESLLLGVIGTGLGLLLGYFLAQGLLVGMGSILEEAIRIRIGGPSFSASGIALAVGLGVGLTVLAGFFPALSATNVSPLEALRPSQPDVEQRDAGRSALVGIIAIVLSLLTLLSGSVGLSALGILLFVVGLALVGPALIYPIARVFGGLLGLIFAREGQIAQGNLTRQPGRAAVTASAITVGLALLVACGGLITSMVNGMDDWINTTMGSDYIFMPQSLVLGGGNIGAGPQFVEGIQETPGVSNVTALRQTTAKIDGTDLQLIGIDPVGYPQIAGLIFSDADEETVYADIGSERAIIVNGIFAAQNQVKRGDTLTLQSPAGEQRYRVVGIGGDFLNYKLATGYISHANMEQDFNESADILIMVNQSEGADPTQVEAALKTLARDYPAFNFYSGAEWQAETGKMLAAFNGMYILLIILSLPALLALINTLAINVLERTREIGTLRAVGATRNQIRRMITAESLLLAATGTIFGLLAGLWLGYVLVGAIDLVGLSFPFSFSYAGIVLAIVVGLGFGIVGALIPARQAVRLDIVRALAFD
ncbi:MAG: ABC transporter permease [Ardenticatenales bacterium]|nr:ABC transporter permease [Ardenticatenales bacterium]